MEEISLNKSNVLKVIVGGKPNLTNASRAEIDVLIKSLEGEIDKIIREFVESDRK